MTCEPLRLREYEVSSPVRLTTVERDRIVKLAPSITIVPEPGAADMYRLCPGSFIGSLQVGDLVIHILPKIPIRNVLFMVSYTIDNVDWLEGTPPVDPDVYLIEIIAIAFLRQLHKATCRGLLHGYRQEENELLTVRGRIRIAEQIRRRYGATPPGCGSL